MEKISFVSEVEGVRLDSFLAERIEDFTRTAVASLIEKGNVTVNGKAVKKNYKLSIGEEIEVNIPEPLELDLSAENIPLEIAFEDAHLLVVNKPKGMVVHPAPGNYEHTLVNALLFHCEGSLSGINGVMRPGIVHRIDKDTSGLLMVAKNDTAHKFLAEQIKEHSFYREYEAVVVGNIKNDNGTVSAPIGRHPVKRKQMAVTYKNSKPATTHYEVIKRYKGFTHLRLRLETGRTHQIRVHMAHLGHPVAGDTVYGGKNTFGLCGQCLHAKTLGFIHPKSREYMEFSSSLPEYFAKFLKRLEEI